MASLLRQALSVRTGWPLLRCSWSEAISITLAGTEASLATLIGLVSVGVRARQSTFPITHRVAGLDGVVLVHLIVEGCGSDGPT